MPAQTTKVEALILIAGVTELFTIILIELDEAALGLAQSAELVSTQETASAFDKVEVTNEAALAPLTLVPLIFH